MLTFITKIVFIWLIMIDAAIINGVVRDKFLYQITGPYALPLSGISLSLLVFLICFFSIGLFNRLKPHGYFIIGLSWVCMTLVFEYLFGHFVTGKSWNEITQVFDLKKGDFFILVLVTTIAAPWLSAKLRQLL